MPEQMLTRISYVIARAGLIALVAIVGVENLEAQSNPTLRVINLLEPAANIDAWIDDAEPPVITRIEAPGASSARSLSPGLHNLKVGLSGTGRASAGTDLDLQLDVDSAYSVVLFGSSGSPLSLFDVRAQSLQPAPGTLLVRYVNSTGAPSDEYVMVDGSGTRHVVAPIPAGSASSYIQIVAGLVDFSVVRNGTDTIHRASASLAGGGIVTFIPYGSGPEYRIGFLAEKGGDAQNPLGIVRPRSDADIGRLRIVNLFRRNGGGGLRVIVGPPNGTLFESIPYASATEVRRLPFGERTLDILPEGGGDVIVESTIDVIAGVYRAVYVLGSDENDRVVVLTADATAAPQPGRATVRFLDGRPDTSSSRVLIRFSDGSRRTIEVSTFGAFTQYERRAAGDASVAILRANEDTILFAEGAIPPDASVTLVATTEPALFMVDDTDEEAIDPLPMFSRRTSVGLAAGSIPPAHLYPNPARSTTTIDLPRGSHGKIVVVDAIGRVVATYELTGNHVETIDVGSIPAGSYTLIAAEESGSILSRASLVIGR